MRAPGAPLLVAAASLLACACSGACPDGDVARRGPVVVGVSVGPTAMERAAAEGLRAAVDEAARITQLGLTVLRLYHSSEEGLVDNVRALVDEHCAFAIAGRIGNSSTEARVLGWLANRSVPVVAPMAASGDLRNLTAHVARFPRRGGGETRLPLVVNVRASGSDELYHMLAMLARDWETAQRVAMAIQQTPFGHWAIGEVTRVLQVLRGNRTSSVPFQVLPNNEQLDWNALEAAGRRLFETEPRPKALIVCLATPEAAVAVVKWMARSGAVPAGLSVFMTSWMSATDVAANLTVQERGLLVAKRVRLFFTQTVPDAGQGGGAARLDALHRRFAVADVPNKTRDALEGYLSGWFIYEVAQHAVARLGLPLTREKFLRTVFRDMRTFNVMGFGLGPYGDGGLGQDALSLQSANDSCNQGMHEVFLAQYNLSSRTLEHLPGASLKFAGCTAPTVASESDLTIVGSAMAPGQEDRVARAGLLAAVMLYDSGNTGAAALRTVQGNLSYAGQLFRDGRVVALVRPTVSSAVSDALLGSLPPLVSPMPGFFGHRRPFRKRIVNLFPSSLDEMSAALKRTVSEAMAKPGGADGLLVLGGTLSPLQLSRLCASWMVVVLNSQVTIEGPVDGRLPLHYRLSVSPPMSHFPTTSALRTEYATWVSSDDVGETSFQSFLVGKFMSMVVHAAIERSPGKRIEAADIVHEVYKRGSWTLAPGVDAGPFKDACNDYDRFDCCNQGLDTIYVVDGTTQQVEQTYEHVGDCGKNYLSPSNRDGDTALGLGLGLGVSLGAALIVATAVLSIVVWRSGRTVEFLNIRKGEIELSRCLGHGRLGSLFLADWHGTAVAVRVIEKRATPKEDQRVIKEEVLLLSRHHHPNVLLLLGFCETPSEIMVVTEYLEGGTLADYIKRFKGSTSVFSLISMAFDVLKGIAYLHSCKPPIVHGSINKNNLLIDARGTVKVTDFWVSSKNTTLAAHGMVRSVRRASWLAPEVISCTFLTPATDVYAFAVVLWELISPLDTAPASQGSDPEGSPEVVSTASVSNCGCDFEMHTTQLGPPEIPPNVPPDVSDLLERCWQAQPERRPSVFQILRNWPSTFASYGVFEVPKDWGSSTYGEQKQSESSGAHSRNDSRAPGCAAAAGDEMAESMISIMPHNNAADALQTPVDQAQDLSVANQLAVLRDMGIGAPAAEPVGSPRVTW
eukprot:m51a1_g8687 putative pas domain-containing protein tyrosine kinase (1191) ;mRNA; r:15840-20269